MSVPLSVFLNPTVREVFATAVQAAVACVCYADKLGVMNPNRTALSHLAARRAFNLDGEQNNAFLSGIEARMDYDLELDVKNIFNEFLAGRGNPREPAK